MRPKRILMTADAVGGVWTFALELASGLAAEGVGTVLAVLGPPPDEAQRRAAMAVPGLRLEITGLDLEWRDRRGIDVPEARAALPALARESGAELVHVNGYREAAFGFGQPVLLAAHSCVASWWRACRGGTPPADWDAYLDGVRRGLAAAGAVVVPSHAFLSALEAHYGPLERAAVIHNGRDSSVSFRAGQRRKVILTAGRLWDEAKNVAVLAAAAKRLSWPVLAAGEGEAVPGLRPLGRLAPHELLALMAKSEIFCAPSRYEPFGLAVLEAAASGAALVLSDIPTFRELWEGAARFAPADDPAALAGVLEEVIADGPQRRALQQAARERAKVFTRARMTRGYLELYQRLLAGTRPGEQAA
ncbi:glycosyltransferase family 4 protein [Marinimicrococcus flavescens]|uniref:Glycosyltransferase family 4 protein n=1 Tax=Marinimicrococcus flavescens TaxID=3031815 RepID=A0AAP3XQ00_9PROT|nr:glycosyltransferase family 4 protein [Marinimicrococcus flavescens]